MTGKTGSSGRGHPAERPGDADFDARRDMARENLDRLVGAGRDRAGSEAERSSWFEAVYDLAEGDAARVPWARLEPHELLQDWLGDPANIDFLKPDMPILDVGCGIGDNAEALANAGPKVTAFDLSKTAIGWARQRFPSTSVDYLAADLFDLPQDWAGRFALVHECYTVQALEGEARERAGAAIASCVADHGHLLLITRSNPTGAAMKGPPWPLRDDEVRAYEAYGLSLISLETRIVTRDRDIPHIRALFRKS